MLGFNRDDKEEKRMKAHAKQAHEFSKQEQALHSALGESEIEIQRANTVTNDIIIFTQDFADKKLESIYYGLQNYYKDPAGNWKPKIEVVFGKYIDAEGNTQIGHYKRELGPLLNQNGISKIMQASEPYFSQNLINSNLDELKINFMLKKTKRTIRRLLATQSEEFGLGSSPSVTVLDNILDMVMNHIKPTPFRALNDGERRHMRQFTKKIEASLEGGEPPKKGFFGGF